MNGFISSNKIEKNRIPKESPTRQIVKCCRLGLIEPIHGRYWKVQVTVHAPLHRLEQNSTFKHKMVNFEFRTAVIMEPSMWHSSVIPWKAAYGPQVIESLPIYVIYQMRFVMMVVFGHYITKLNEIFVNSSDEWHFLLWISPNFRELVRVLVSAERNYRTNGLLESVSVTNGKIKSQLQDW
jgi:hypothetical protein